MEHWPGHERQEKTQITNQSEDKGKRKEHHVESNFWQWPHLEYGSIGRTTLVARDGRVECSSVVDTYRDTRWLPLGRPTKVFPEIRSPQISIHEHSDRKRAEKGLQYLRTYFPDADFPGELLRDALEADARETRCLKVFDPFLGNLLEIIPSYTQNEPIAVFPMGELGRELNISRISPDSSGHMVFIPAGLPSFTFETPILQISSAVGKSEGNCTSPCTLLIRTQTSSSLFSLEHSKVARELDITRSEVGDAPIMDSRILASGPDIVVVNRNGKVYKCNTYRAGKAMQLIGAHEVSSGEDFWQLGITGRSDQCFLASSKVVEHIDLRVANSFVDVFSLDHPTAVVTSFESPMQDYISRVTTTSDVIWLDDRFRRRPLLSYKHYRSFDRTLKVLTANLCGTSLSLLTSRRNGLVTPYDVNRGSDGLLHCNAIPSCLPHAKPMSTMFDGHALIASPLDGELVFLRLTQRGSIHRQDIHVARLDTDQPGDAQKIHVTHQWNEDVQRLAKQANELQIDFGSAGGRHYTEVNLRGAYEKIFAIADDGREDMDQGAFEDMVSRLPQVWNATEESANGMLTTFDVVSSAGVEDRGKHPPRYDFLARNNFNSKQAFGALMRGHLPIQELRGGALWHYNVQNTSIPALRYHSDDHYALHERLKELNLVFGAEGREPAVQRETEAREELVVDLALSSDVYSPRPVERLYSTATDKSIVTRPVEMSYGEEPPEVKFGYFRPVRKAGADHYGEKEHDGEHDQGVSSPLGVRLLLAEWELGTDPKDYTYRDPYGLVDADAQPIPQYRKLPVPPLMTQKKQTQPQRPPLVVAAATQPPVIHIVEWTPPMAQAPNVERTHSQQWPEPDLGAVSQEPMMSTQVLPGRFGGRPDGGKKAAKKRIGGF